MRLRFHPEARAEYTRALVYLEDRREGYGQKFELEVFGTLERALELPGSGASVPGFPEHVDVRQFPLRVFRYSLILHFDGDDAIVYAVAHQHRKPGYWGDRLK
jgi:plasmid stabilization system protein ParE